MSEIADLSALPQEEREARENFLFNTKGFLSWALTLDHKRIGLMYLVGVMSAFFIAGMLALLIRLELMTPTNTYLSNAQYNQVFTPSRGDHGVFVYHPQCSRRTWKLLGSSHVGGKGCGFPASKPS